LCFIVPCSNSILQQNGWFDLWKILGICLYRWSNLNIFNAQSDKLVNFCMNLSILPPAFPEAGLGDAAALRVSFREGHGHRGHGWLID